MRDGVDLEDERPSVGQSRLDQVFHHFVLRVDGDRAASGQFVEVNAMPAPIETQFDPVVHQSLAAQPLAHPRVAEQVDRALLENSRADALLHVSAALRLDHDRFDALPVEQVGEQQARGSRPHDAHLRANGRGE